MLIFNWLREFDSRWEVMAEPVIPRGETFTWFSLKMPAPFWCWYNAEIISP